MAKEIHELYAPERKRGKEMTEKKRKESMEMQGVARERSATSAQVSHEMARKDLALRLPHVSVSFRPASVHPRGVTKFPWRGSWRV